MIHCNDTNFISVLKEHLLYHKIINVIQDDDQTAELTLDNGTILIAQGNDGCGGCSNGWYYLTHLAECDNAIMNVELITEDYDEKFSLYVMTEDKRLNVLTYEGTDNGYYGVGFYITVKERK